MATVVGEAARELREDIPLKTGTKQSSLCSCNDDFFGGSRLITIAFAILTTIITVALLVQIYYGDYQVVPHGSVASDSRECSEIGTSLLKQGGNAVDAAVATAFCLCVVNPHTAGLDGVGQILIYNHRTRQNADVFDFSNPKNFNKGRPKLLISLAYIHNMLGLLPWKDIIIPSANLARKGFFVSKQLETAIKNAHAETIFGTLQAGSKLELSQLGETLTKFADKSQPELFTNISELNMPTKTQASNSSFKNFNVYVPNLFGPGPQLFDILDLIGQLNFTSDDVFKPEYVCQIANATKFVYNSLNLSDSFHQGTSTNVAVIDRDDLCVSLIIGMYSPFGSQKMVADGYLLDVTGTALPYSRLPIIITDANLVCGKRIVLGANNVVIAAQVITNLLVGTENATSSIEFPRFNFLENGAIGIEDDDGIIFNDIVVKELEHMANVEPQNKPYDSCNIVEKIADDLNSHSDSRGGGISSRF